MKWKLKIDDIVRRDEKTLYITRYIIFLDFLFLFNEIKVMNLVNDVFYVRNFDFHPVKIMFLAP